MHKPILALMILVTVPASLVLATDYSGTVKVGYTYTDLEGNLGVNQGTFNLYDGATMSLENFSAALDNGYRVNADLYNLTLGNRRLRFGVTRPGLMGVSVNHSAYRRYYDFNGDVATKRHMTDGRVWWQAHKAVRLYGDFGFNNLSGEISPVYNTAENGLFNRVDYSNARYGIGLTYRQNRRTGTVEYRGTSFSDDLSGANDRGTRRMRVSLATPVPRFEDVAVNGGFQSFRVAVEGRSDSLFANTLWGGARWHFRDGYSVRYSFLFDRARRTGDPVATDNLVHALYAGKVWRGRAGVTAGYQRRFKDDLRVKRTGNNWSLSAWAKPWTFLTLDAGHGSEKMEVDAGQTLTGERERDGGWASAKYTRDIGWLRLKVSGRSTEYEEIGAKADYTRVAADTWLDLPEWGQLSGAYSFSKGKYENTSGQFEFNEQVVSGDITSREWQRARLGLGGTYYRSKKDTDVEAFTVRVSGRYTHMNGLGLEVVYSSHNYDNFADPHPICTEYYTDNVVEVSLTYDLR
jgi:hypothetical protein